MGKHIPTDEQKLALWTHYRGLCFWCQEPVGFRESEIDHFIPEHLEKKPLELDRVRADYGLSASFLINDYCNWLPIHRRCNQKKGGKIPKLTLLAIDTLDNMARDAERIRAIEQRIKRKYREEKGFELAMLGLKAGLNTNRYTNDQKDEMRALLADPALEQDDSIQLLRREVYLDIEQHYFDFLNRRSDPNSFAFWSNQIAEGQHSAGGDDSNLLANVSAAFFLSTEFYDSGYLVYRMYLTAFGSAVGESLLGGRHMLSVPMVRLSEFVPAIQQIGQGVIEGKDDWQAQLEANKQRFMLEFISRSRFNFAYPPSLTPSQFVDSLNTNAGTPLSSVHRNQLVSDLSIGVKTRAQVLREVAEHPNVVSAEFNRAFVLMQYFGYLRRDANDTPDTDFSGYDFWLRKLNEFNGDYVQAEMIKAFVTSDEYRKRFGAS
jgi:hypothetical protein